MPDTLPAHVESLRRAAMDPVTDEAALPGDVVVRVRLDTLRELFRQRDALLAACEEARGVVYSAVKDNVRLRDFDANEHVTVKMLDAAIAMTREV